MFLFNYLNDNQTKIYCVIGKIWFIRISILMKLKFFKEADIELKQFENFERNEFFYEAHPEFYPNRKGKKKLIKKKVY